MIIKARFKTRPLKQWDVAREFNRRLKNRFDELGIEIPFPHQTVYFGVDQSGQAPPVRVDLGASGGRPGADPAARQDPAPEEAASAAAGARPVARCLRPRRGPRCGGRRGARPRAAAARRRLLGAVGRARAPSRSTRSRPRARPGRRSPTQASDRRGRGPRAARRCCEGVSETIRLADRPPPSLIRLRRRAEDDRPRLQQALRSRGYYDARITVALDPAQRAGPGDAAGRARPAVPLSRGRRSTASRRRRRRPCRARAELGIAPGAPALSQAILDAEAAPARGRARAGPRARRARPAPGRGRSRRRCDGSDPGRCGRAPLVRFGEISIEGLSSVEEAAVRRRLPWQPGEVITTDALAAGRSALFDSGLFSSVVLDLGDEPDAAGQLPVTVELNERRHRSIGIGARYRTDEGPGGNVSLEHRNLFGARRAADHRARRLVHRRPSHRRVPQARLLAARSGADRRLAPRLRGHRRLREPLGGRQRRPRAPARARHDALRPARVPRLAGAGARPGQRGVRPALAAGACTAGTAATTCSTRPAAAGWLLENEPFVDVFGNDLSFNKSRLTYTHYLKVLDSPGVVLAGRGSVGTTVRRRRATRCRRICASMPAAAARCAASAISSRATSTTTTIRSAGARCSSSRARCACA